MATIRVSLNIEITNDDAGSEAQFYGRSHTASVGDNPLYFADESTKLVAEVQADLRSAVLAANGAARVEDPPPQDGRPTSHRR